MKAEWDFTAIKEIVLELVKHHILSRKILILTIVVYGVISIPRPEDPSNIYQLITYLIPITGIVTAGIVALLKQSEIDKIERIPQEGEIVELIKPEND